ncbi:hypothetical protein AXE65_04440 [Ventosimonas gracilis]|uniref:DUF1161 domain-containing protein n=1 Tax=Ventosimonas gracilis TaxID=1680762 RepID=A0A139SQK6_9GAMM|nr:DUF1161 domain-containing protein [Ventosimonas gracilis]KXU36895.1 hypothetical protein AXE65_04440 [Ventosimonas gracilis]
MCNIVKTGLILISLLISSTVWAGASCEELKEQIDANIYGNGVRGYLLEILSSQEAELELNKDSGAKIVGSCGAGKQKIVYWRDNKPAAEFNEQAQAIPAPKYQPVEPSQPTSLGVLLAK